MLPVESCLLEAVDLQGDKTLQYSFLRAPRRREKSKMYNFLSARDVNVISCLYPKQVCGGGKGNKQKTSRASETVQ